MQNAQALAAKLVVVQEDERKRLSRDLHDDFGHRIVDLKLQLSLVNSSKDHDLLISKIDALYQAMKKSIGGLRPSGIDTLPIESVIERSDIITTLKRANIDFSLNLIGTPINFKPDQKIHIYRIVQEAVTNSIKYANAKTLSIDISYDPQNATFTVTDDGEGIPETTEDSDKFKPTLGLLSMKERAKLIDGTLNISHNYPMGTAIRLSISANNIQ